MAAPLEGVSVPENKENALFRSVACPFCGLHCDDLAVRNDKQRLTIEANGCPRAAAGFEKAVATVKPQIAGRETTLDAAIARAAELIGAARLPLFGGLATDVEGMRGMMALADRAGGVVDHVLSAAQYRNVGVLQTSGWIMSTLTETRNRADIVVIVASDLSTLHPRFIERVVSPAETMFGEANAKRTVVLLGRGMPKSAVTGARIGEVIDIDCEPADVPAVLAALRAALHNAPAATDHVGGVPLSQIASLAERFRASPYCVFVWAPQALTFDGGDLAVHIVSDIVRDLNKTTRAAGLSLGGNDGIASAASVCSWQSGYPLRVSFASGAPEFDPLRFEVRRMLAAGEGDLLVWTASFGLDPAPPPPTSLPTIVIGAPGIALGSPPAVYIPVGTPGLDHSGRLVRCDNVVSLPVRKLRSLGLASVGEVAGAITAAL